MSGLLPADIALFRTRLSDPTRNGTREAEGESVIVHRAKKRPRAATGAAKSFERSATRVLCVWVAFVTTGTRTPRKRVEKTWTGCMCRLRRTWRRASWCRVSNRFALPRLRVSARATLLGHMRVHRASINRQRWIRRASRGISRENALSWPSSRVWLSSASPFSPASLLSHLNFFTAARLSSTCRFREWSIVEPPSNRLSRLEIPWSLPRAFLSSRNILRLQDWRWGAAFMNWCRWNPLFEYEQREWETMVVRRAGNVACRVNSGKQISLVIYDSWVHFPRPLWALPKIIKSHPRDTCC